MHELIDRQFGHDKGIFVKTDVTKGAEVQTLVQTAVEKAGRLDKEEALAYYLLRSHSAFPIRSRTLMNHCLL